MKMFNSLSAKVLAIGVFATAPLALFGQTCTIKFNPKNGSTGYRMQMQMHSTGQQAMNMSMDGRMRMAVKNLKNGNHRVTVSFGKMTMMMNGKPGPESATDSLKNMTITMVMDKHGKTIKTEGTGAAAGMGSMLDNFTSSELYNRKLTVGKRFSATSKGMGAAYSAVMHLASVKTVHGRRLATLVVDKINGAPSMMNFSGHPTTIIDIDTGMLVSVNMAMSMNAQGNNMTTTMSIRETK